MVNELPATVVTGSDRQSGVPQQPLPGSGAATVEARVREPSPRSASHSGPIQGGLAGGFRLDAYGSGRHCPRPTCRSRIIGFLTPAPSARSDHIADAGPSPEQPSVRRRPAACRHEPGPTSGTAMGPAAMLHNGPPKAEPGGGISESSPVGFPRFHRRISITAARVRSPAANPSPPQSPTRGPVRSLSRILSAYHSIGTRPSRICRTWRIH